MCSKVSVPSACALTSRGYSMIELVLTILLISIIAVGATTLFPGRSINLAAQAQQVASDIRYTQSLSMTRGERHRINFATSTTYVILNSAGVAVAHPATGSSAPISLQSGITLAPLTSVRFDGKGTPSSAPTLTLTADGSQRTVTITAGTGRVAVP